MPMYYYGFANEGLWPLCHRTHVRPVFRSSDFAIYRAVNARFAAAVGDEADTDRPLVLVQDYHFALAPRQIRARLASATIVAFWHIPWPNVRDFSRCPWARQLLDGLLGSTIAGFQTPEDCLHFIDAAEALLDAEVDRTAGVVHHAGRSTSVRAYPVSIEWPNHWIDRSLPVGRCRALVRQRLGLRQDARLCLGVDRLDYTKGIDEKFLAVERLLESRPDLREHFVLVQIAEPSRQCLQPYRDLRARVRATADRINLRFGTRDYRPLVLLEARHEPADVYQCMRAADICYVGSLHDGMNLVAKEFVSARDDERGVLILSQFAGSAHGLPAALIVNPYAIDDCARALSHALQMPLEEQNIRMRAMRSGIARNNAYYWAAAMLVDAAQLRGRERPVPGPDHRQAPAQAVSA